MRRLGFAGPVLVAGAIMGQSQLFDPSWSVEVRLPQTADAVPLTRPDQDPPSVAAAEWSRPRNAFAHALVRRSALSVTTTGR